MLGIFQNKSTPDKVQAIKELGIRVEESTRSGRCHLCLKIIEGMRCWVQQGIVVGDPVWSIQDRIAEAHNLGYSAANAWCVDCAFKLTSNRAPRKGPPPPAPKPQPLPEFEPAWDFRFGHALVKKGGARLIFIPNNEGHALLTSLDDYFELAKAGQNEYGDTTLKAIALILLDQAKQRGAR
jgi:hypothetical protein